MVLVRTLDLFPFTLPPPPPPPLLWPLPLLLPLILLMSFPLPLPPPPLLRSLLLRLVLRHPLLRSSKAVSLTIFLGNQRLLMRNGTRYLASRMRQIAEVVQSPTVFPKEEPLSLPLLMAVPFTLLQILLLFSLP